MESQAPRLGPLPQSHPAPVIPEGELTPAQCAMQSVHSVEPDAGTAKLEANFEQLHELVAAVMPINVAARYFHLFHQFGSDQTYVGETYLGMERAPAAKGNHHAFEGGLVHHYLEMWRVWCALRDSLPLLAPPHVTDERVLAGIIAHDLHKAYCTFVQVPPLDGTWLVKYGAHESARLMNSTMKSTWMLAEAEIHLDLEQAHALGQSEGGWSDQKNVGHTSVLAKLLYCLDELSAGVLGRIEAGTLLERDRTVRPHYMSLPDPPAPEPQEEGSHAEKAPAV